MTSSYMLSKQSDDTSHVKYSKKCHQAQTLLTLVFYFGKYDTTIHGGIFCHFK